MGVGWLCTLKSKSRALTITPSTVALVALGFLPPLRGERSILYNMLVSVLTLSSVVSPVTNPILARPTTRRSRPKT